MKPENSSLLLLGVGGAGATTVRGVRRAYGASIRALTVDADASSGTSAETPFVLIGGDRLAGRGAGGLPAEARAAFLDKPDVLDAHLEGVRTAVIVTALGGGTGSGATSEIVRHLSGRGIVTIVFATLPFSFEGAERDVMFADGGAVSKNDGGQVMLVGPDGKPLMDGKAIPVDVFVDCTNTVFYYVDRDGDKSCEYSVERRLILVSRGKLEISPPPFVVSRHGIGVLRCIPDVYSCLGTRILTGPELMNFADDVQNDMKGLDAVVETRRDDSSVEYSMVGRWRGRREIVIKINSNLHDYICGVGRLNEEE